MLESRGVSRVVCESRESISVPLLDVLLCLSLPLSPPLSSVKNEYPDLMVILYFETLRRISLKFF